jgi:hypothetical protein
VMRQRRAKGMLEYARRFGEAGFDIAVLPLHVGL